MKRKLSTSSVAAFAPEFVVPRVPIRHRSYVVPRYRARPHGAANKLFRVASVSALRVVPPPQGEVEEVESQRSSRKRSLSCDNGVPDSPATVFASPSSSRGMRQSRCTAPARFGVRCRSVKGKSFLKRKHNSDHVWYSSKLAHKTIDVFLSFSSRRVRIAGSVDNVPVNNITVDTATDGPVVSLAWVRSHPTLRGIPFNLVPPAAVALRAANGEPINVVGFIDFPLTLSELTRTVTALVVPSLGPDLMLLDNSVMSDFGARLDWNNQTLSFSSTGSTIPAVHRIRDSVPSSSTSNPSPASHTQNMSVAAVHHDADAIPVSLCERVNLKPEWESLAVAYTDCLPPEDCTVVVEPRIITEKDFSDDTTLEPFKNILVARTLAT